MFYIVTWLLDIEHYNMLKNYINSDYVFVEYWVFRLSCGIGTVENSDFHFEHIYHHLHIFAFHHIFLSKTVIWVRYFRCWIVKIVSKIHVCRHVRVSIQIINFSASSFLLTYEIVSQGVNLEN